MAAFNTNCPHCSAELQVQEEWIGMEVECPMCKNNFIISANEDITRIKAKPEPVVEIIAENKGNISNKFKKIEVWIDSVVSKSKHRDKIEGIFNIIRKNKIKSCAVALGSAVLIVIMFSILSKEQEVNESDLISHNGKLYYQKLSNGPFSGVAMRKDGNWIKGIIHYKKGVLHGKRWFGETNYSEEEYWKNGELSGPYLVTFKTLLHEKTTAIVKGQYKKGKKVGTWKYTCFKDGDEPQYEIRWKYNATGDLHGVCQTPLYTPKSPWRLFHNWEEFFDVHPGSRRISATYAEAEFLGGRRVSKGKLIKVTPTGKRVEISY